MGHLSTLPRILTINGGSSSIKFAVFAGWDKPERLLTGTRPEPTFLITKPFQRSTVKAAIAQALFFDAATVPA